MNVEPSSLVANFSLVIGGPFYRTLRRLKLVEPAPNIRGRILALLALTWLPLVILAAAQGAALGGKVKLPLLRDFSIYGRFFVGLPLLIIAEIVIDPWIRRVVSIFNDSGIIRTANLSAYYAALKKIMLLRDSGVVELVLLLLASFPFFMLDDLEWISPGLTTWHGTASGGLSAAGWWFAFVSSPILRFLLFRWLWRYLLWSILLYRIMKLDLNLMPAHPDSLGGLGFVLNAQRHFGILFAAIGGFLAGQYGNSIAYFGASLMSTRTPIFAFVTLSFAIVLCPLVLFTPKLVVVRRNGLSRYSQLARSLTGAFDAKWVDSPKSIQQTMLGNSDPSSLIDYLSSYNVVKDMKVFPINKQLVIQVAAEAAAPLALLWLAATPVEQIITGLLKMLNTSDCSSSPARRSGRRSENSIGRRPRKSVREWEATASEPKAEDRILIAEATEKFLADAQARKLKDSTIDRHRILFRQLEAFAASEGIKRLDELETPMLNKFRASLKGTSGLADLKKLERLRSFFKFAQANGYTEQNPASAVRRPKIRPNPTLSFSQEEMLRILAAAAKNIAEVLTEGKNRAARASPRAFSPLHRPADLGCDRMRSGPAREWQAISLHGEDRPARVLSAAGIRRSRARGRAESQRARLVLDQRRQARDVAKKMEQGARGSVRGRQGARGPRAPLP